MYIKKFNFFQASNDPLVVLTRDVLNNKFPIESWFNIENLLNQHLKSLQSKDELIAYFRFLAVKAKFDYFVNKVQFENAKGYFSRIVDIMYKNKDFMLLGYFVYFTQYFSCKKEEEKKSSNPFEEEEEFEDFFEGGDSEDSGDKENDVKHNRSINMFNDSVVSNNSINQEEVSKFLKNANYHMMVDTYYLLPFCKDRGYWIAVLTQFFKVKKK